MNKKGFASSTIVFSLLSVFLIAISILLVTMTNTNKTKSTLNEKVVSNIEYGNSSINDIEQRLKELENNTLKIDDIYPVGSIYMSTEDDTIEKVQERFGGKWEKYSEGRTLIGEGTGTDSNGVVQTFKNSSAGGEYSHTLTISELPKISGHVSFHGALTADFLYTSSGVFSLSTKYSNYARPGNIYEGAPSYGTFSINFGENVPHNNMGPYIVTYMYKRVK